MASAFFAEPNQVKWQGIRPGNNGEQILVPIDEDDFATIYTVPADKLFLLFDWGYGTRHNHTSQGRLAVMDDGAVAQAYIAVVDAYTSDAGTSVCGNTFVPIEMIEGWEIKSLCVEPVFGYIHGILVDV